ncbi:MAG TPA: hypothetical protein VF009_07005 [Solirubrobacterales bacterium]
MNAANRQFKVAAHPLYSDGTTGDMCAYEEAETLPAAMAVVAKNAEAWLDAPAEVGEDERSDLIGFDLTVELCNVAGSGK